MKKSLEFVEAVYDDLKGLYVATKKDLKALAERHNFQSARVDEWLLKFIIWSYTVTALMLNWSVRPKLKTRQNSVFASFKLCASGYCQPRMPCITHVPSWRVYVLGSPSCSDLVVLSKVFVVRYYHVGCLYYCRGGSSGIPRLVLRQSQPITGRRPIPKRGTSETVYPIAVSTTLKKITAKDTFSL